MTNRPGEWPEALRARPMVASVGAAGRDEAPAASRATSGPDYHLHAAGTGEVVMTVQRDPQSGRWQVRGDDGSILEDFISRGAAQRWCDDRADLSDREVRSMVERASPRLRTIIRAMLDEIEAGEAGGGGYGPT